MGSLYPTHIDSFRKSLSDEDQLLAGDLNDVFDAVIAIETELGVNPGKSAGTIRSRLFGNGNISAAAGYWIRLKQEEVKNVVQNWYRDESGFRISIDTKRFKNRDIGGDWGDGVPAIFISMQDPLISGASGAKMSGAWWTCLVSSDPFKFLFVGTDGQGSPTTALSNVANGATSHGPWLKIDFGVFFINMIT